ncbi:type IV pilus biogenesis/stability protein PilW [Vogesella sp. LIG4]|uniref:type IV pilus biogenesis/stability protein PilW n=1 Tax=Vogesella sp. LIG4 TaxID=1192162 RepID=UPI00081F788B|nr:type IV pilus biogenesis/stability protein PilW [Vogesella sp. LIG4]SCK20171.1 type IV pilus assembly protein PilF [Vogesella sp. LIG4]
MLKTRVVALLLVSLLAAVPGVASAATPRELAQTRALLAIEYMKFGNMRVAMQNADQAIATDPGFQPGYLARALILMQLGVDKDADQAFQQALRIDNRNPEVNNNYGYFLCARGRYDEALQRFDQALADPFFDTPQSAMVNKALCLERMKRVEDANQLLLAALRRAPNDPTALRELTRMALDRNNVDMADFYFQRIGSEQRQNGAPELWLGVRIARLRHDAATAEHLADLLKKRFPDSPETLQLLSGN